MKFGVRILQEAFGWHIWSWVRGFFPFLSLAALNPSFLIWPSGIQLDIDTIFLLFHHLYSSVVGKEYFTVLAF